MGKLIKKLIWLAGASITGYAAYAFMNKKKLLPKDRTERFERNGVTMINDSQKMYVNQLDTSDEKEERVLGLIKSLVHSSVRRMGLNSKANQIIMEEVKEALQGIDLDYILWACTKIKVSVRMEKDFSKVFNEKLFSYGVLNTADNGDTVTISSHKRFVELGIESIGLLNTEIQIKPEIEEVSE